MRELHSSVIGIIAINETVNVDTGIVAEGALQTV